MNGHIICFKGTVTNYYVLDCYGNDFIINGKLYIFFYVNEYTGPDITL